MKNRSSFMLRFLLAVFVATVVFVDIFLIAYSISYLNYQKISEGNSLVLDYINRMKEQNSNASCSSEFLSDSSQKLDEIGSRLSLLENRFGKSDPRVLEQKGLYATLEYSHFNIVKNLRDNCGTNFTTIFFFYSNDGKFEDESDRVSFVLGSFKRQDIDRIMIYSFDFNSDTEVINSLKERYNISEVPSVLVNEERIVRVENINDLEIFIPVYTKR